MRRQPWDRSEALARRPMDVMRGEATVGIEARGAALMLAGTSWTDGTALLRLAADPEVGPRWLLDFPAAAAVLGATVVPFLVTVSVALYIPPLRRWALMAAALFHIITGVWFSIPDMALAFLVGLAAWLSAPEVAALERVAVRVKSLVINRM